MRPKFILFFLLIVLRVEFSISDDHDDEEIEGKVIEIDRYEEVKGRKNEVFLAQQLILDPPLLVFGRQGALEKLQVYLRNNPDIDINSEVDADGWSSLHFAAEKGFLSVVQVLIIYGANVNLRAKDGKTPLIVAGQNGHLEVIQYLLRRDAHLQDRDYEGKNTLFYASEKGHLEVVKYLVRKRTAGTKSFSDTGETPLHVAAGNGHLEVVKILMLYGADANQPDESGRTALHSAIVNGRVEVVAHFLSTGSNIVKTDEKGANAIWLSCQAGNVDIRKLR